MGLTRHDKPLDLVSISINTMPGRLVRLALHSLKELTMKAQARTTGMLAAASDQARHMLDAGKDVYDTAAKQTKAAGKEVDRYVHDSPWIAIGAAVGVGVLI